MTDALALEFDRLSHKYALNGRELISVTQAIREAGLMDDAWWTEESRLRGEYVHRAILLHHEGDLAEDALDPVLQPYYTAYQKFLSETGFVADAVEERICDPVLGYAGTLDLRGHFPTTRSGVDLLDVKTGAVPPTVGIQLAAYARALPASIVHRWALNLQGDSTYRLVRCTDANDLKLFFSCLAIAQFKRRHL